MNYMQWSATVEFRCPLVTIVHTFAPRRPMQLWRRWMTVSVRMEQIRSLYGSSAMTM